MESSEKQNKTWTKLGIKRYQIPTSPEERKAFLARFGLSEAEYDAMRSAGRAGADPSGDNQAD